MLDLTFSIGLVSQIPDAHTLGATAVSWSPAAPAGSLVSAKGPGQPEKRVASSGADNTVKVCVPVVILVAQEWLEGLGSGGGLGPL